MFLLMYRQNNTNMGKNRTVLSPSATRKNQSKMKMCTFTGGICKYSWGNVNLLPSVFWLFYSNWMLSSVQGSVRTAWQLLWPTAPSPVHQSMVETMELVMLNSTGYKVQWECWVFHVVQWKNRASFYPCRLFVQPFNVYFFLPQVLFNFAIPIYESRCWRLVTFGHRPIPVVTDRPRLTEASGCHCYTGSVQQLWLDQSVSTALQWHTQQLEALFTGRKHLGKKSVVCSAWMEKLNKSIFI